MSITSHSTGLNANSLLRAVPMVAVGVAFAALVIVSLSNSTIVQSRETSRAAPTISRASASVAPVATMPIVPAAVIDNSGQRFVGTGDGAGTWLR